MRALLSTRNGPDLDHANDCQPSKCCNSRAGLATLVPTSQLYTNSISKGIFLDICKLAQVIPILKMIPDVSATTTDPYCFLQT